MYDRKHRKPLVFEASAAAVSFSPSFTLSTCRRLRLRRQKEADHRSEGRMAAGNEKERGNAVKSGTERNRKSFHALRRSWDEENPKLLTVTESLTTFLLSDNKNNSILDGETHAGAAAKVSWVRN